MTFQERMVLTAFKFAWWGGRSLPRGFLARLYSFMGHLVFMRGGISIRRLTFNLARVSGESPDTQTARLLARKAMLSYFRYWNEMFQLHRYSAAELRELAEFRNREYVDQARSAGSPVVIVATHSGNWDLAGVRAAQEFGGITTVAERLKPEELFQLFTRSRQVHDIEILPHIGGDRPASELLIERLRQGRVVALAADRDMSRRGIPVQLCHFPSQVPAGPAKIAMATKAMLIPAAVYFEDGRTVMEFYPAVDTSSADENVISQNMADAFSAIVSAHPENWHMLQQVWLDHPTEWGGRSR
jgi:KDO2-lipid IV(A) lauroyltransferase